MAESSSPDTSTLLWLRRDLRLRDHPGWDAALSGGGAVIPVFILDPHIRRTYGAAPSWRLGESLKDMQRQLADRGSRLILRRGDALEVLRTLVAETGARRVVWSRLYEPAAIARDRGIKAALQDEGVLVRSVNSSLLFEPWEVSTKSGGPFKVYAPFWRAVAERTVHVPIPLPGDLAPPSAWPFSERLEDWDLGRAMNRGADIVARHACIGEDAALKRLDCFADEKLERYGDRDFPDLDVCSRLSENLTYGEIGPRQIWTRVQSARQAADSSLARTAVKFVKELIWREFAYHLMYRTPALVEGNWRPGWDRFPWRPDNPDARAWRRGRTGIDVIDAAMREMYVTGTMHNRARMLVASFLTKHLMTHWRVGADWFADCLIDWDPASNAMGWQWTAGSGPDAAPYFRVFNPDLQAAKFDPDGAYRNRFLPWRASPGREAEEYHQAVPASWGLTSGERRPEPIVGLTQGRERALAAWRHHKTFAETEQEEA